MRSLSCVLGLAVAASCGGTPAPVSAPAPAPAVTGGPSPGCGDTRGAATAVTPPQTEDQKTLYALGLSIGRSVATFDLSPVELALVQAGLAASVRGDAPAVSLEDHGPKLGQLSRTRIAARAQRRQQQDQSFLDRAAAVQGAVRLPSGLVYEELRAGAGDAPTASDLVKVHYTGTLTDGTEFDSSFRRGEPATFPLAGVIPCWTEGMQKMKIGGKARLTCPSVIAYGDRGSPTIPGGAALVFVVELLEISQLPAPPGAPAAPAEQGQPAPRGDRKPPGKQP